MAFERLKLLNPAKTEKLFHRDVDLVECRAKVLEVQNEYVVLDRTVFYAESGGQEFDTGYINDIRVSDVQDQGGRLLTARGTRVEIPAIKIDTTVVHQLAGPAGFAVGEEVLLRVDQTRRRNLMRSHSAAHFLFQAAKTVVSTPEDPLYVKGCHIAEDAWRFDFAGDIKADVVQKIEEVANGLISRGGVMEMVPSEVSDEVFYWTWEDVVIPCGGTHVRKVDELKKMRLSRTKKGANLTRIKGVFVQG
ncbi:alanine--tRNA ligase-related protein [Bradyrhizobium oligotrophicum]|uniref:alanine--tRNA ligase-related protein n=1 Tax=Bradyrhizobium oligotrophicum TaxID=44255 RepID=UPI003EB886FD